MRAALEQRGAEPSGDAHLAGEPADQGEGERGGAEREQHHRAEPREHPQVLGPAQQRVPRGLRQIPDGPHAAAQLGDPADAGGQQQEQRDDADGGGVVEERLEVERVGDPGDLVGGPLLHVVHLVPAEQRRADRGAEGEHREERQEADEGDRRGEPGPVPVVEVFVDRPGAAAQHPYEHRAEDGQSGEFLLGGVVHDPVRLGDLSPVAGIAPRTRGRPGYTGPVARGRQAAWWPRAVCCCGTPPCGKRNSRTSRHTPSAPCSWRANPSAVQDAS